MTNKNLLKILFVEDLQSDAELAVLELRKEGLLFKHTRVDTRDKFLQALKEFKPEIIISDYLMPTYNGMQAFKDTQEFDPFLPFIIITGSMNEETAVECLKAGATDYVIKEHMTRLPFAVKEALEQHRILIEKRAAELLLRENEEKLQSIFSAAPVGIGLVVNRVFVEVNDTFCKMTGYGRKELTGKNTGKIYPTIEESERVETEKNRQIAEKGTGSVETRFKHKDGRDLDVFLSSEPLDQADLAKGETFIAMDITAKKQAATALRVSEEKYRRLFENVHDLFYETSMDGTIIEVSPSIKDLSKGQYNRDELIGKPMDDFYADPEQRMALLDIMREQGFVSDYEILLKNRDGMKIPCSISAKILFDSAGRPEKIIGIMRDITDRKLAEDAISNERRLLRTLIDNLPDQIYVKDSVCRKIIASRADVTNIGFKEEAEVLMKTDMELFPGPTGERGYDDDKKVISSGKAILDHEEDFIDNNGERRWLLTSKLPLYDKDGKITGLVGIGHDITQRKENEAELILAKEKAEESDRLKTAFLNNVSHEIRTPLNAIVGFASILGTSELTADKKKEVTAIVNSSSDQLLSILSGILSLASLEAGQEQIVETRTDLNQLLLNVYEQFLVNHKSAETTFSYHPELPDDQAFIYTDPVKLTQILVNLVGNALKFTHKGRVRFGYTLVENQLQFFVEDTGIGIPEEMHQLVFERFRQVDNSATRKYGGTGLGLALSKGYVTLMGGSIGLTSETGKGSTFFFTLPYKPVITNSTESIADQNISEIIFPPGKIILVAEDEINNFLMIDELLTSVQLKVIRAANGLEAVNICASGTMPDLVLMDIKMPVMDGIEATKKIKELNPGLPVVAVTAFALEGDKERFFEAGCDCYLEKPVKHKVLIDILLKFLSGKRS